jgi:hypothetical protein
MAARQKSPESKKPWAAPPGPPELPRLAAANTPEAAASRRSRGRLGGVWTLEPREWEGGFHPAAEDTTCYEILIRGVIEGRRTRQSLPPSLFTGQLPEIDVSGVRKPAAG